MKTPSTLLTETATGMGSRDGDVKSVLRECGRRIARRELGKRNRSARPGGAGWAEKGDVPQRWAATNPQGYQDKKAKSSCHGIDLPPFHVVVRRCF